MFRKHQKTLAVVSALLFFIVLCGAISACSPNAYLSRAAHGLNDYTLDINFDDSNKKLSVVQQVTFTNNSDAALEKILFHIHAAAYRQDANLPVVPREERVKAYVNGYSYGDITFETVKVGNDAVAYTIEGEDGGILAVPLAKSLFPGEKVRITMVYEVALANIWHRLGYGDTTINLGNFFPILCRMENGVFETDPYYSIGDPFNTDMANFTVNFTAPSVFKVAHTGRQTTSAETGDGDVKHTYSARAVRDFALMLSKSYQVLTDDGGGVTINYYFYNDPAPAESLKLARQALDFFSKTIGEYPYETLAVCETDFCYGGMEYPNLVMISSGMDKAAYRNTIVHEIAHQWFYGLVGNDQIRSAWMDEGLVEFLTAMFFEAHKEYGITLKGEMAHKMSVYMQYVDVLTDYLPNFDSSLARDLSQFSGAQEYVYIIYVKSALMFNDLYNTMGEARFCRALQLYFDRCKLTMAQPQDMFDAFSRAYGAKLDSYFSGFLNGTDLLIKKQ